MQLPMQSEQPSVVDADIGVIFQFQTTLPLIRQVIEEKQDLKQEHQMPAVTVTPQEEALLKTLGIFHYFTAEKLAEYLRYSPNSLRKIKKRLQQMEQKALVEVANRGNRANESPFVYTYGKEGHSYLQYIGEPVEGRYRPAFERIHKAYPLDHTMAVNEVLLKAIQLEEQVDYAVSLSDYRSEADLKAKPLRVQNPGEEKPTKLSPDLWLDFQAATRRCLCMEVNLSRVWQRDWRHLIQTYINCMPAYEQRFGTDNITIAFIINSEADFPKKRLSDQERARLMSQLNRRFDNYIKWTKAELIAHNLESEADAFLFTKAPILTMTPEELYLSPHWINPFSDKPKSLLRLRKEADHI